MYISKIKITNFRNFLNKEIEFNDGVNVIIGHNNAGKTNLIKALSIVLDHEEKKRLDVDDFNKHTTIIDLKSKSPKITISVTIKKGETANEDDLVTISNWLTKLEANYEALLTYEFFLPEKHEEEYKKAMNLIDETDPLKAIDKAWKLIKHEFIRLYIYRIWGGEIVNQSQADGESLQKFDFQFLDAIRDVERDMLTGRNSMLRDVLDFFLDYDIKSLPEASKSKEEKEGEIKAKNKEFSENADVLITKLQKRMEDGKKHILSYAEETGASFNKAIPNFKGNISEVEMFSVLKLIIEHNTGIKVPATHNGLGYNNLIFMSLLLAKMQVNATGDYLGSNSKVFSTLAIEEPEAHLHPAMQYKFLKFLKENKEKRKVRQIFVTSHSTHITSAVELDEIICLHSEGNETNVGYPGKVFPDDKSKKYVQRFLDATKSDMLFAQKVILVEGLAEQLLLSILAKYTDLELKREFDIQQAANPTSEKYQSKSLEDNHIVVINVGGRYFDHFLHLFDTKKNPNAIPKKVACLTDRDPEHKKNEVSVDDKFYFEKCYPFEYNQNTTKYNYKNNSSNLINRYQSHSNIRFFSQNEYKGKTFEYDLVLYNPTLELLVTDSMSNSEEIKELMKCFEDGNPLADCKTKLRNSEENNRIKRGIDSTNTSWTDDDRKKAIIASRYLNSVGKGENALELAYALENNLNESEPKCFNVPQYIKDAIEWICR